MNRKPCKLFVFLILIIIALSQTSCQKKRAETYKIPGDSGLLSQEPCGPPCFYGITPGVTSRDKAEDILVNSLKLNTCYEYDIEMPGGILKCDGIHHLSYNENYMVTEVGYYLGVDVTVKELIEKYGEPDYVAILTMGFHKDYESLLIMYYPNIDMSVYLNKQEGSSFTISPETFIDSATYSNNYLETKSDIFDQEWKGYGEYFMGSSP